AAAVQAGIPFGVKFAHLHGGETTLGAIDNVYRHQITLASRLHFPATSHFANRIADLLGNEDNIFTVGSLSIDELNEMPISSEEEFRSKYDIKEDFALLTFHPETVSPKENTQHADFVFEALHEISQKILLVITMPNADTFGTVYRSALLKLKSKAESRVVLVENFGKLNYFAAMRYSKLLIGNTSSGIIEAASFGKYVINVGDRQKGRAQSGNVFDIPFSTKKLTDVLEEVLTLGDYTGENIYHIPGTVELIIDNLKKLRK
ncbi:MAG: UDP-N-acetylglucosamine 2-epimerase (hydrolyzing), partial [Pedobacter sp.]